jgi:hypothetical protein
MMKKMASKQTESRYSINRFDEYVKKYRQKKDSIAKIEKSKNYGLLGAIVIPTIIGYSLYAGIMSIGNHSSHNYFFSPDKMAVGLPIGAFYCAFWTRAIKKAIKDSALSKKRKQLKEFRSFIEEFDSKNKLSENEGLVSKCEEMQ